MRFVPLILTTISLFGSSGEATLCRRGRPTPTALRLHLVFYEFWPLSTPAKKNPDPSGPTAQRAAEAARKFHFVDVILSGLYRQQPRFPVWPPLHRSSSFILSLTASLPSHPTIQLSLLPLPLRSSCLLRYRARRYVMHSDGGGGAAPRIQ